MRVREFAHVGRSGGLLVMTLALSGCLPAIDYAMPDPMPIKGPLKRIGSFTTDARGCGSYTTTSVDERIIRPAIQSQLKRMGAVTADNVIVSEKWYDIPLGLLLVPVILGCSNWTITGEALVLDRQ